MQRITRAAAMTAAALLTASGLGLTGLQAASAAAPTPIATGGVLQILSPNLADRGTPQFADGPNVRRFVADTTRGIDARMTSSPTSTASFTLTPPDGKPLAAGSYQLVGSQQADFASVPTLRINDDYVYGAFDILDVASNPTNGTITRFDAVVPGIGEFRFGEDKTGSVLLGANSFSFKKTFIGLKKNAEQVETVHNTGTTAVALGKPSIAGADASSFSVMSNTCRTTLAAGAACTFRVGFAPKTAGPSTAKVAMKIGTANKAVRLTGSAYLGTTSITSSGKDIVNKGKTTTVNSSNTAMLVTEVPYGWTFIADRLDGSGTAVSVHVEGPYRKPLAVGTRKTTSTSAAGDYEVLTTVNGSSCDTTGTETVKQFLLDPVTGLPDTADMSFTQYCFDKIPQTGTLKWQARSDVTAPAAPTAVKVSATTPRKVTWKASASKDAKSVVARLVQGTGAGATAQSGIPLTISGTTAAVPSLHSGQQYTVLLFSVDAAGNVSKPATARFGTAPVTVMAPGRPTITAVTSGRGTVTVSFTPSPNNGGLPTSYTLSDSHTEVTGTTSPLTLTGVPAGDGFVYITPRNAAGEGKTSASVGVTVE